MNILKNSLELDFPNENYIGLFPESENTEPQYSGMSGAESNQ
ncbi:hypothetical protein [Okeania sp.]|nr:hypothetical protein [Okeania sp.]MEB3342700.1 hypothetical protein [Okeania sp.]